MDAHPELAPQMLQVASLRSQLRALRGAIDAQEPRVVESNRVMRETAAIRSDLAQLSSSMDSRRRALAQIRVSHEDIDQLAEAVASAARETTDSLRRDRERLQQRQPQSNHNILHATAARQPPGGGDRESMLEAARDRMRRRGVLSEVGASAGRFSIASAGGGLARSVDSMFERLAHVRAAEERVAAAVAAAVQGEPIVDELNLLRTLADDCSICLEKRKAGEAVWVLPCGHCFHAACCRRWLSGACTCPLCKRPVERKPPQVTEGT